MPNIKIVSGGQTGVDRAALDAALKLNVDCGGWCPEGRKAEDGIIPPRYPLIELAGAGYKKRTLQNVIDSDGTVIIYFDTLSGGTEKTLLFCLQQNKPYLLIDATELSPTRSAERIHKFVTTNNIKRRIQLRSAILLIMRPHAYYCQKILREASDSLAFSEADC
jgi:putative molybdenum carrier protein